MDTISDAEAKAIWGRVKSYLKPSQLKSEDIMGLSKEIERQMREAAEPTDKSGSINTLLKKGFAERVARIPAIQRELPGFKPIVIPPVKPPVKRVVKKITLKTPLPTNITRISGNRLAIKTKKVTRRHLAKNIQITRGTWKGKRAFWAYNTNLKKLISWGLT